jgi:hypothetical protein
MHPAKVRRLAAALGAALPVLLMIAAPRAAEDATSVVTPISAGLNQTVAIGPAIIETSIDPLTGLVTSQRTQETTVVIEQIDRSDFSPCTGEPVLLSGRTTLRMKIMTGSDGRVHELTHQDSQGKALGTVSGAKYVFNSTSEFTANSGGSGASEFTVAAHEDYIRANEAVEADDFFLHMTFHFTVVNGVTTSAFVDNFRLECK